MYKATLTLLISSLLISTSVFAKPPKVKEINGEDGWYRQNYEKTNVLYLLDSKTKLCFAKSANSGLTEINCRDLQKRKEWKKVIEEVFENN